MIQENFFSGFRYLLSTLEPSQLPEAPKLAFLGRSNSGKSTLINTLTGNSKLAKVSKTPGKTRTLNCFQNSQGICLIDLPGFGFSKANHKEHSAMMQSIENFLNHGKTVQVLCILCDSGRELPEEELLLLETALHKKIPVCLVRTKIDKLNQRELHQSKVQNQSALDGFSLKLDSFFVSASSGRGIPELKEYLQSFF